MTQWTGSILLSEGQIACVDAQVASGAPPSATVSISSPEIKFSVMWDGETFVPSLNDAGDLVVGYTFTVGSAVTYHYTLKYTAEVGGLSQVNIETSPDCEITEASVSLIGG